MDTLQLWCLSMASRDDFFPVKVGRNTKGADLVTALKQAKPNEFAHVDTDNIRVFTAKAGSNTWIPLAGPLAKHLKSIKVGRLQELFKVPGLVSEEVERWEELKDIFCQTHDRQLHILVVTPLRSSTTRADSQKLLVGMFDKWEKADKRCPALEMGASPIVRIPAAYALGSGLTYREEDLVLYRRPNLLTEWQAIAAYTCNTYAELWIVGPYGVGKSCAAFAFACSLDRTDWDVVWIHIPRQGVGALTCILFRNVEEKWTCFIDAEDVRRLLNSLQNQAIVFLDGYLRGNAIAEEVQTLCTMWRQQNKLCHRLVCASSMVPLEQFVHIVESGRVPTTAAEITLQSKAVYDASAPKPKVYDEELIELESWTMDEYEEALANDEFYEHVKTKLERDPARWGDRRQLLKNKFFVVGGCARYMFGSTTEEATQELYRVFQGSSHIADCLERRVRISSTDLAHQLFSWFRVGRSGRPKWYVLSKFVAGKLAQLLGPEYAHYISSFVSFHPTTGDYFLELGLAATLVYRDIACSKVTGDAK